MEEAALVFDVTGALLWWHLPYGRTHTGLPDSRTLWMELWKHRDVLGGVAHTHPWSGFPLPSNADLSTFAAIERGLGKRLIWPIITFDDVKYYKWVGPGYRSWLCDGEPQLQANLIEELRNLSGRSEQ